MKLDFYTVGVLPKKLMLSKDLFRYGQTLSPFGFWKLQIMGEDFGIP
jgi:hypothetical protein